VPLLHAESFFGARHEQADKKSLHASEKPSAGEARQSRLHIIWLATWRVILWKKRTSLKHLNPRALARPYSLIFGAFHATNALADQ